MNQLRYVLLVVTAIAIVGVSALALNVPNTFVAGEVISAAEVNANFTAVEGAVTALQAQVATLEAAQPRVAHARAAESYMSVTSDTEAADIVVLSIDAPAAGVVVVQATAQAALSGTTEANRFVFRIDDEAGGLMTANTAHAFVVGALNPPSTTLVWNPVAIQRAFEVTAGTHEFRLEAQALDLNGVKYLWNATVTATWYPAAIVTLADIAGSSAAGGDNQP